MTLEEVSNIIEVIREQINTVIREGKRPAVILMSLRTKGKLEKELQDVYSILDLEEIYGIPVKVIEEIEGHLIQVIEKYPLSSDYDDLYEELEISIIEAERRNENRS